MSDDGTSEILKLPVDPPLVRKADGFLKTTDLKRRGWTDSMIRRFLGEPDAYTTNPRNRTGPRTKLFRPDRCHAIEATPEFAVAKAKIAARHAASLIRISLLVESRPRSPYDGTPHSRDDAGAIIGSVTAEDYAAGRIDRDLAELLAFKSHYRHKHTNYECLLANSDDRAESRHAMKDEPIPSSWPVYLHRYGFWGDIAEALSRTFDDPTGCHPTWFKEAEIAVRRNGLDLTELTYEGIRAAIESWRSSRPRWNPAE